jgi:hypothetical protein
VPSGVDELVLMDASFHESHRLPAQTSVRVIDGEQQCALITSNGIRYSRKNGVLFTNLNSSMEPGRNVGKSEK